MDQDAVQYNVETTTVTFQGREITLTNRTPIFTQKQREQRKMEIEHQLYDVVSRHYARVGYNGNA